MEPKKWICADCGEGYDEGRVIGTGLRCSCGGQRIVLRSVAVDLFGEDIVRDLELNGRVSEVIAE